jgi:hypothetical protein
VPTIEYQIPGAVFKVVTQVGTASIVAPTVVPVIVCAQLIFIAPVQSSFGIEDTQVLAKVNAPEAVPKPVTNT